MGSQSQTWLSNWTELNWLSQLSRVFPQLAELASQNDIIKNSNPFCSPALPSPGRCLILLVSFPSWSQDDCHCSRSVILLLVCRGNKNLKHTLLWDWGKVPQNLHQVSCHCSWQELGRVSTGQFWVVSEDWNLSFVCISIFNSLGTFDGKQGSEPLFYIKHNSPSGARHGAIFPEACGH